MRRLRLLRQIGRFADELGLSVFLVGGVVRDLLLKRETWDLDLTVEGDGVAFAQLIAGRYGARLAVFERFATTRLIFNDGLKLDIATTRRESYSQSGSLPDVEPASLKEDLYRRDFTINAMAIQLNIPEFGLLYDPYGGCRDLKVKTIRLLHAGSFLDDPTRIFRAIRFEQRFGFRLQRATARMIAQASSINVIRRLSGPRLRNEILSLFAERNPVRTIARLAQLRLLRFLHRRLQFTNSVKQVIAAVPKALAWWMRRFPDSVIDRPILYLMALSSESSPLMVTTMIRRLALSREQAKNVIAGALVDRALKKLTNSKLTRPSQVYRLLYGLTDEALVLLLAKQGSCQSMVGVNQLKRRLAEYMKSKGIKSALTGRDLQAIGLKPGPQYKTILGKLLDARIDGLVVSEAEERVLAHALLKKAIPYREHTLPNLMN